MRRRHEPALTPLLLLALGALTSAAGCTECGRPRRPLPSPLPVGSAVPRAVDAARGAAMADGGRAGILRATPGPNDSRYRPDSPLWKVLERARQIRPTTLLSPSFRFTWGDPSWHAEGAIAMAVAAAGERIYNASGIHKMFCPARRRAPCLPDSYLEHKAERPVVIAKRLIAGPTHQRKDTIAACRATGPGEVAAWATQTIRTGRGGLVPIFVRNAFQDTVDGIPNSVHVFALYGVEGDGSILLRDAADRVPVTYRLRPGELCDAMAVPLGALWGIAFTGTGQHGLAVWTVATRSLLAGDTPPPRVPRPEPVDPSTLGPPVPSGCPGLPAVAAPVNAASDPLDMGTFTLPADHPTAVHRKFRGLPGTPGALVLRVGVSHDGVARSRRWLDELERRWMVTDAGDGRFRHAIPSDEKVHRSALAAAYAAAAEGDGESLSRLAAKLCATKRVLGRDSAWLALAIIRLVQSLPYEIIEEDTMGLRPPVVVLRDFAGDCDSKSLLGAVLLRLVGFNVVVAVSNAERHAVLGLGLDGRAGTGTYIEFDAHRYVLVEMTIRSDIGDMTRVGLGPGQNAGNHGWEAFQVPPRR